MKITKRYFDQSQREYEEIERKLELEKQGKTAEELAYEKRMVSEEGKVLFDKIKKAEQNTLFIRNKEKYDHFVMLYKGAIKMAELLGLNVEINTENPYHATIVQFAPSGGRKCVFQRPLCGAERPLVFS